MDEAAETGTTNRRNAVLLATVAAALAVGAAIWLIVFSGGGDASAEVGLIDSHRPEVGQPAPDFALLDVRDGESVIRLSDFRGKVVVLNWYASWCGPCRAEIPDFQEAYTALPDDLVILGVNLEESQDLAAGLLEELGATYPAVMDSDGEIAQHYRVSGMPTTFVIDRDGNVAAEGRGIITEESLRQQLATFGLTYPES